MRTLGMVVLACGLATASAHATDREFRDVVDTLADAFHTRPTHIPFFGLVNVVTFVARPAGTKHINLAVFENLNYDRDGRDTIRLVRRAVGEAWKPFVQVWSHRDGHEETVLVYLRMEGHDCRFLVTSIEPNEATVVELKLNPDALQRWLVSPEMSAHSMWTHNPDRNRDREN